MRFDRKQHFFAAVPQAEIQRSAFNRSSNTKTTFNSGYLVPVYVDEVLPGDTVNLNMSGLARLATPIRPIMDNMYLDVHFFFVPNRLVWSNFQKFMGEQINPGDSTSYLVPKMSSAPVGGYVPPSSWTSPSSAELASALNDYFGIPTRIAGITPNSLHHRAYNIIWNQWYRDENLQTSVANNTGDGPDTYTDYQLLRRGKRHDYFTSCLPWPQKGAAVSLPLGTSAPVISTGSAVQVRTGTGAMTTLTSIGGAGNNVYLTGASGGTNTVSFGAAGATTTGLQADLTAATAATINQLRQAFQIQRLYERDARGGTRYTEIIHSHFGVISPDARLQRPEYLGGGSCYINFNAIAQNSAADSQPTPQGNLAATATGILSGAGFVKSFTEHGVLIGLVSVRAEMTYQQGMSRMWTRQTRLDFYWPALAHIGEQAVLNQEIYTQGTSADTDVFGYQERYGEYRYKPSMVTGKMRSTDPAPLDTWHLAQKFTSLPVLNDSFIVENPPVSRVIAVPSEPEFVFDAFFDAKWVRPMPIYSVPGNIDRF